jgi:hypothetical protein
LEIDGRDYEKVSTMKELVKAMEQAVRESPE